MSNRADHPPGPLPEAAPEQGQPQRRQHDGGWPQALMALLLCIVWVLFWYRDTAVAMVGIWYRSETFTHAFLVPPISLWLIWGKREQIAAMAPRASPWIGALVAGTAFGWLLGDLVAVNAVTQLALVATLVLLVPAVLGIAVARTIVFPLAFLFFAVPIGEFVMGPMMDWTAHFTVLALRLTGIPVYQEGLHFVIPSGRWSVVQACSGVRYLIASLVVGTLFAYLSYHSLKRRLIFIGVAIIVPIIANWMRAYIIVMLGHLSGNTLAVGADHLIYGWVFFGIVISIMFVIGARWTEAPLAVESPPQPAAPGNRVAIAAGSWPVALLVMALAALPHLANALIVRSETGGIPRFELKDADIAASGWKAAEFFTTWQPVFENPSVSFRRSFEKDGARAAVHIAYYRNQNYDRKLVNTNNVLVNFSDPVWASVRNQGRVLALPQHPSLTMRESELRGGAGERVLVWQWYWINGTLTASDHQAKLYGALSRLRGRGDDSAAIILHAPLGPGMDADKVLAEFSQALWPAIERELTRARDER